VTHSRFEAVIGVDEGTRPIRVVCAALVLAVLVPLAACSSPSATQSPTVSTSPSVSSTSPSTPSPSPDPTASASSAALASYDAFWVAQVNSQAHPAKPQDPNLAKYSIDKALAGAQETIILFRRGGVAMLGKPTHETDVTGVKLGDPPTVSITDCVDSTNWKPVYVATGKSALAPGQSARVLVESTATVFDGRWVISSSVAHRDRSC
jgi:hypothetical protein